MKAWEALAFASEEERRQYYANFPLPPGHSVAAFWQDPVFKRQLFARAHLRPGTSLLLISEANERCGLSALARDAVGEQGRLVEHDVIREGRTLHEWNIYERLCRPYAPATFDAAIATTTHHMQQLDREMGELIRVVKPGGWLVVADNGPGKLFFELAKQDAHLEFAADLLIYAMAVWLNFGDSVDEAYANLKRWGCKYDEEDLLRAMRPALEEVGAFAWKGLWLVAGRKR
ncbi:MAG: methyltransferase domain-containing protein [Candidatus Tectomicrobia bacterium]|nr:methyltransferase domain-containing protein [Candidatus Tectomicrobia bacterium]